jgi:4-aminobutyrate aminotransferase
VAAIQKQAADLIHMSGTDFYYESMITLAERLSKIAPMPGPHKIYYGNSGTEAVECALKLARYHTKRQHVIAFLGAFHGRTMGSLSLTASKPQQRPSLWPTASGSHAHPVSRCVSLLERRSRFCTQVCAPH